MQILVSVNQTSQAILASQLGAQWIDIKDPSQGSLGAASQEFQQQVLLALLGDPAKQENAPLNDCKNRQTAHIKSEKTWPNQSRPNTTNSILSVALGEISDYLPGPRLPIPLPGFHFAKLGTAGIKRLELATPATPSLLEKTIQPASPDPESLTAEVKHGWFQHWIEWSKNLPDGCTPVLVAYADADHCQGLSICRALQLCRQFGLPYLLVDTFDKNAVGLFHVFPQRDACDWIPQIIQTAKDQGTRLAWAGKLTLSQLQQLTQWDADIAGVRSAICTENRTGEISPEKLAQVIQLSQPLSRVTNGGSKALIQHEVPR